MASDLSIFLIDISGSDIKLIELIGQGKYFMLYRLYNYLLALYIYITNEFITRCIQGY